MDSLAQGLIFIGVLAVSLAALWFRNERRNRV
jgi:hypothetical protein